MLRKRFRKLGVWMIHTLKLQIQDVEPRRRRLSTRTLPCIIGKDARIKKLWCIFCVIFGVGKREKTCRETRHRWKMRKCGSFQVWWVPGAIYSPTGTSRGDDPWRAASSPSRTAGLERLSKWLILTPLNRFWLPISKKVWILKIQRSDRKLWLSEVCDSLIDGSSSFRYISTVLSSISTDE